MTKNKMLTMIVICGVILIGSIYLLDGKNNNNKLGFILEGEILSDYKYNPTGELIFPTVIKVDDYVKNPMGKYYLYYAPHDAPGGIALAYADDLNGPWSEYDKNPVISKDEFKSSHKKAHVSSPHIIWNENSNKFYMYFHGPGNDEIKVSESSDGVNFTYIQNVVTTKDIEGSMEVSYARVFKENDKYLMLLMANMKSDDKNGDLVGTRKIYKGMSVDGLKWTIDKEPLIDPKVSENVDYGGNVSGPTLLKLKNKKYIVFHGSKIQEKEEEDSNMYYVEIDDNFEIIKENGVFLSTPSTYEKGRRDASPTFIEDDDYLYMFYEGGEDRLSGRIMVARVKK